METDSLAVSLQKNKKLISPTYFLIGVFLFSYSIFAIVELFRNQLYFTMGAQIYLLLHNIIEVFSIIMSISIFIVGMLTYKQTRNDRMYFLSYAFLGIGLLDFMHILSFPGMPNFITPSSTNKGILFWITARLFSAIAFLSSAFISRYSIKFRFWKQSVLATVLIISVITFFGVIFYEHSLPSMFVEGVGLTSLKIYLEYVVIGLFVLAYVAYLRRFLETKERIYLLYLAAINLSIFSELAFTLYKSAYDTYNLLGHIYKFAAFCFIYAGIFNISVKIPFVKLLELTSELKEDIAEREKLGEAIKESEEKFRIIFDNANDGIVLADIKTKKFFTANKIFCKMLGYNNDEIKKLGIFDIHPKKEVPAIIEIFKKQAAKEIDIAKDIPVKRKDGEIFYADINSTPATINGKDYVIGIFRDVSERKKSEEALEESVSRLNEAQHIAHIGNWNLDIVKNVLTWSDEIYKIFEIDQKKFGATYEAFLNAIHPDDRKVVDDAYTNSLKTKVPYSIDHRLLFSDGRIKYVHEECKTIYDKNDNPIHSIGTVQDITERKNAEENLKKSEERLRLEMNRMPIGYIVWDKNFRVITWNPAAEKIFGFTFAEAKGKHPYDFIVPKSVQPQVDDIWRRLLLGDISANSVNENTTKDGHIIICDWTNTPLKQPDGTVLGVMSMVQDITERKKAELELNRANRALKILSEVNQALIHVTNEPELLDKFCKVAVKIGNYQLALAGIIKQDITKEITMVAQAGIEDKYLKNIHLTWADTELGQGPEGTAIRTGQLVVIQNIAEDTIKLPLPNDTIKQNYKSVIALPLTSQNQTFGVISIYSNEANAFINKEIDILKEASDDLAFGIATLRMRSRVEERTKEVDQLKNKFVQIVSHQLRTPLTTIRWQLENLLSGKHDHLKEFQKELVQNSYNSDLEIISRINDLVTALDIEEKREIYLDKNPSYLRNLWKSVEADFSKNCEAKKITYKGIISKDPVALVDIDIEKVRIVLEKISDNALTYTKEGGKISTLIKIVDGKLRFEITDNGVGIPEAEQQFIFTRFYRASNAISMKPDASGLGLYIAKHFIEAHGGKMGFESTEGKGSTFWFEIPIKK